MEPPRKDPAPDVQPGDIQGTPRRDRAPDKRDTFLAGAEVWIVCLIAVIAFVVLVGRVLMQWN